MDYVLDDNLNVGVGSRSGLVGWVSSWVSGRVGGSGERRANEGGDGNGDGGAHVCRFVWFGFDWIGLNLRELTKRVRRSTGFWLCLRRERGYAVGR